MCMQYSNSLYILQSLTKREDTSWYFIISAAKYVTLKHLHDFESVILAKLT